MAHLRSNKRTTSKEGEKEKEKEAKVRKEVNYKGKGKSKGKGKQGDNKAKGKGYNKGGKGYYQGWNSWSQGGYNNNNNNNNNKGQGRGKGKGGKTNAATVQCHICKKAGHVAANCWYKDSTYTTAAVGSGTTGQTQHFSMDHPTNDQPVAIMPRDQLPLSNQHGKCISGSYVQATTAPRAATSGAASYMTTPGPVLHDVSQLHCGEVEDCNYNYNQQLTNGMNHEYARELPAHYLKHWGLLVDTGAYVSVALKRFALEVLLEPVPHPVQLLTATSTHIKIYGTRTVLLVTGRLSFHVRFTDVKQTLLGLQDILQGDMQLNLRDTYTSTIQKDGVEEPLLFHDKHFYVEALVLPQDHQLNYLWLHYLQNKLVRATTTVYYTTGDGEVHEQAGEAQLPRSNKPPRLPTEEERLLHELTHQPYRSWCEVCQHSKGRPAYHKRQPKDKESVIQMDYGFLQDPHLPPGSPQQRKLTVLTMLETTTGLSNAILTTRKGDTTHQRQQIKKWIATNAFANSILQTDSEAAILQLGEHVARELGLRFRASPPHSHQSNGAVERIHAGLFLQHSVFILNKYLVKDTGTTAHQNNYHQAYNNPICQFGEAVLADTRYLVNYKLRQRNLDQKIKGSWTGKDPTTDEHLIALPPSYDNHPSVTGSIYKCRGITRLPRPNMWDTTFLATIHWPPMESMDQLTLGCQAAKWIFTQKIPPFLSFSWTPSGSVYTSLGLPPSLRHLGHVFTESNSPIPLVWNVPSLRCLPLQM